MGDKTLILQQFFAMSLGLSVENIYYIAIAVLACVFGAEIAGICILINKMRRARRGESDVQNDHYNGGANYAIAALSFGAVSATAELTLLVLAIAAAAGAFVLCILLAVLHSKGYLLISAKTEKKAAQQKAEEQKVAVAAYAPAEEPEEFFEEEKNEEELPTEEPEIDYTETYEDDEEAQKAIANLIDTEDAVITEEAPAEEAVEEEVEEEPTEVAVIAEEASAPAVEPAHTFERTVITEGVPGYAGQGSIVEKHIIETTREVIKETNTTTVTENKTENPVTEEMLKAIDELKQLGLQLRMEREVAVAHPAQENSDETAPVEVEDEEIDVDETDADDEADAEDEAEREADAEENDDEYESELFGNERIVGFDEETGCYIIARYRKSCEAKLMQSRPATKKYYSAIRNALMGYEGTKERMSWTIDTYTNEHAQIARINIRPRTLDLYLALEPSTLEDSVYRGRDVSDKKKYAETPFLYKVNSPRKLTLALELVQRACEEQGLSPIDIEQVNYEEQYPFTDTETLIVRGLVREYLREEKPAATFELDPDHVPQLAEEDETVIPANANFTWEFDNDQPEVEEELIIEEEPVVEEEIIEEEPVADEEPVIVEEPEVAESTPVASVSGTTTTTTTHETIRTTERHYTERYFSTGAQAQITEETRTIEVLPEPASEPIEVEAEEILPEEVAKEPAQDPVEEAVAEEVTEEAVAEVEEVEEIIDDEIEEEIEETTEEEAAQIQSAVAALFGDDLFEDDEPVEEPTPEEPAEEVAEEVAEEIEEEVEEAVEEIPYEQPEEEIAEEVEEEIYEEEFEEEFVEEPTEEVYEEPTEEFEEETYEQEVVEEVYEEEPAEEEYYEEETEEDTLEEYYDDEEFYQEEPVEETEEGYYEEEYYEEETEEVFEEEVEEEIEEEPTPAPAPQVAASGDVVLLDVCVFDDYFDNGAIVNLETLKQVGLAPESATRLKVYASGSLKGQFTVEANHFTLDAIKAIGDADGDSIMIR